MDVYFAMTNYHILSCLLHKMFFNNRPSVLYVSSYLLKNQENIIKNIEKIEIFDEVKEYSEIEINNTEKVMTDDELNKEIDRVSNEVNLKIGDRLKRAKNIFMCSDFYSIGFFLIRNNIKYNYFEDGCGVLSKKELPLKIIEKGNPNRARITKLLNTFGENECVINRFGSLKDQVDGYSNEKDIDFCIKDLLKKLDKENLNKVLTIFEAKNIKITSSKTNLLLTMHYNEIMSIENQIKIYSSLIDYFTKDNEELIIKPHPADTIKNYEEIFPNATVLYRYMPAELFPFCFNKNFNKGITCWSTAIYSLKDLIDNIICFDIEIDNTYKDFDKYYTIVMFLKKIKTNTRQNIKLLNINELQIIQLLKFHFQDFEKYYEIEKINSLNEIEEKDIIITNILSERINNKVIEIDSQFKSNQTIELVKISNLYETKEYIGLYNFEEISFTLSKKLNYSKYKYTCNIINENKYIDSLSELIKMKESSDIIAKKENEKKLIEKDKKIWELEQHIKYQDNIIKEVNQEVSELKTYIEKEEQQKNENNIDKKNKLYRYLKRIKRIIKK